MAAYAYHAMVLGYENAEVNQFFSKALFALGEDWDDAADPRLTFFTIDDAEAWLCDIDGSWNPIEL